MPLNEIIQSSRPSTNDLIQKIRDKSYYVDDSFQRRLVWTRKQKVRLIETILMGFPIPEIYLWEQRPDPTSGAQRLSIVDGQQRLTAISQFIANEWPLKKGYLDREHKDEDYADKSWAELPDPLKQVIWNYSVNVRRIPSSVSAAEVRAIFRRLNETDRSLNPQEMRHAEFDGLFLTAAAELADRPFWQKWHIFNDQNIRRMGDVEFTSSLLTYLRMGIVGDTPTSINNIYDLHNDVYPERARDIRRVDEILKRIDALFRKSDEIKKLFSLPVHLYPLFVALDQLDISLEKQKRPDKKEVDARLLSFTKAYNKPTRPNKLIETYRKGASFRTRSKASRENRILSLMDWILLKK